MADAVEDFGGTPVFVCDPAGEPVRGEQDATDLIGNAYYQGASWVAVPAERLGDDFFRLSTKVAGGIVQKFANYRMGLAVLGDIDRHVAGSTALRDFVVESNRGRQLWFLRDAEALRGKLAGE
ncbi:hypothetical protein GCM10023205_02740 [Yinghuangia aomiensis]|uniref:DUF4180 domain-containing protein n=1 Tax=Yinghuangia aomiensis TaxID=676205 RepID=A0ABP9GNW7_9ACTN